MIDYDKLFDGAFDHVEERPPTRGRSRPICPICKKPAIITDERFGGKFECPDHDMWSWGGKPLRTREEHRKAKLARKRGKTTVSMTLDELADDPNAWWRVLGVDSTADASAVKAAFRTKLKAAGDLDADTVSKLKAARDEGLNRHDPQGRGTSDPAFGDGEIT